MSSSSSDSSGFESTSSELLRFGEACDDWATVLEAAPRETPADADLAACAVADWTGAAANSSSSSSTSLIRSALGPA